MAQDQLGTIPGRGAAGKRFCDALLRSLGNSHVTLRLADPSSGDTNSQLGLEPPASEDLEISPALIRMLAPTADGKRRIQVVIGATTLQPIAKLYGVEDIAAWLRIFEGVVCGGGLMRISAVHVDKFLGADCLFYLTATE